MMEMPDFSGDDLGNDPDVRKARQRRQAYLEMLEECFSILRKELEVTESSHENFRDFAIFKDLKAGVINSFRSEFLSSRLVVSLVEYHSSFSTPRNANAGTSQYLFGWLELNSTFPNTMICKETLKEKLTDIFLKLDTDFKEHRKFSQRFYVLTEDRKRLSDLLELKNLEPLTEFPDMEIEIHGNACLFRHSRKSISMKETRKFVELAKTITTVFN